ncbi:unnamed protein product [Effrenium voratum]|uniref:Uncharacterized protein n=1 Tax=Effrenium voratum TaxID=2562239 RepID=A0AA36IYH8_9DINO|nr:unnamed protein product [Effrenium voratum]CAJ1395936.1 unnamed protein product [Effrenium voratum]
MVHSQSCAPVLLLWSALAVASARRFDESGDDDDHLNGLGCYCKRVSSEDECPDEKTDTMGPDRYRFYHSEEKQCCKMSYTSVFTWKGWSYKKQKDLSLCDNETKDMSESCCTVEDRFGSFSVRLRAATAKLVMLVQRKRYEDGYDRDFRRWVMSRSPSALQRGPDERVSHE